ncbi:MAG: hypothetical protein JST64_08620 [Actinobacteria bacterium]|nr:hypothetical protein [Actinomycetota bacterium]
MLQGLAHLTSILAQDPSTPAQLTAAAAQLTQRTGVTWSSEMVVALAASACNDWATDPSDPEAHLITEEGYRAWANAAAPALGITTEQARTAIDSRLWGPFQRLCE